MKLSSDWVFHFLHDKLCQRELLFRGSPAITFTILVHNAVRAKFAALCKQQSEVSSMMH